MDIIIAEISYQKPTSLKESYTLTDYEEIVLLSKIDDISDTMVLTFGASLGQQLVRTILGLRQRNLSRKTQEVILAIALSYREKKTELLRAYLNIAYHGYAVEGCEEASELLFKQRAIDLNREQSALLASLLVYPLPRVVLKGPLYELSPRLRAPRKLPKLAEISHRPGLAT